MMQPVFRDRKIRNFFLYCRIYVDVTNYFLKIFMLGPALIVSQNRTVPKILISSAPSGEMKLQKSVLRFFFLVAAGRFYHFI